jgi:hypothetical protein
MIMARSKAFQAMIEGSEDLFKESGKTLKNISESNKTQKIEIKSISDIRRTSVGCPTDDPNFNTKNLKSIESYQHHNNTNKHNNTITTPQQHDDVMITTSQQHHNNTNKHNNTITTPQQYHNNINNDKNIEIELSDKQTIIYDWFLSNGLKGIYNKGLVSRELNIPRETVRLAMRKLEKCEIIRSKYNTTTKFFDYEFDISIKVKKASRTHNITISQQQHNNITTTRLISKSVSINKNLLTEVLNSDSNLEYWKTQDLPVKKIESWMTEFNYTEEQILNQLRYSAFEWKTKTSKEVQKPIGKFYTALKSGGFSKPTGYKTPEEKRQAILDAELREKEQLLKDIKAKQEKIRKLDFEIWLAKLPPETRKEIIQNSKLTQKQKSKGTGPAIDAVLKKHYDEIRSTCP